MVKRIKQTVLFHSSGKDAITVCPLDFFLEDNWVFSGFKKGTLKKATFELHNGTTITLEEEEIMKRHAHMVDLLRPELSLDGQVYNMQHKPELTVEDLDMIIANAEAVKRAAEIVKSYRS